MIFRKKWFWATITIFCVLTFLYFLAGFPPDFSRLPSLAPIDQNISPPPLGPGYQIAVSAAVEKCGKHIQFLQLQYIPDARYSFTRGHCLGGGVLDEIMVSIDPTTNALNYVRMHHLSGDDREPLSNEDVRNIKISKEKASEFAGMQVFALFKRGGTVVWRANSQNGMYSHDVWVSAIDGAIVRDKNLTLTM
jgi:hypothetical protein